MTVPEIGYDRDLTRPFSLRHATMSGCNASYDRPLECVTSCLIVMGLLAFVSVSVYPSSVELITSSAASSGRTSKTLSSRPMRPRSTYWSVAMLVISLVREAPFMMASSLSAGASAAMPARPNVLSEIFLPVTEFSHILL